MEKVKKIIEGEPQWTGLNSYIVLVEQNRENDPNVALDGAKSLLETVAKTILADRSVEYEAQDSLGKLVKTAVRSLPSFVVLETQDADALVRLVSSMESIAASVGTLRNRHGAVGHGRDLHDGRELDSRLATLGIESIDALAAYLIEAHCAEPGTKRLHYEEYAAFNEWFDARDGGLIVGGIEISASRALFSQDIEAYKEAMIEYENQQDRETLVISLEQSGSFATTHSLIKQLSKHKRFSDSHVRRIVVAGVTNSQIAWIASDSDVRLFYRRLVEKRQAVLSADEKKAFLEFFPDKVEV